MSQGSKVVVNALIEELEDLDRELLYISKIEQRTSLVRYLRRGDYDRMPSNERKHAEDRLTELKARKRKLEQDYEEAKKAFGRKEQQTIELRKLGKTLLTDAQCPLCGHSFESTKELLKIIDSSVVVDSSIDKMISVIQHLTTEIKDLEAKLEHEKLADRAMHELKMIADAVPMVQSCGDDYEELLEYVMSKADKEARKAEIIEQQFALSSQGFSVKSINACYEFKQSDPLYLDFLKTGKGTFSEYLDHKLATANAELAQIELRISQYEHKISDNKRNEELLRGEIHEIDIHLEALSLGMIRELEQAVSSIKLKFTIKPDSDVTDWTSKYYSLCDLTDMEVERIESEGGIQFERQMLAEYTDTIERVTPRVERCAKAVQALERMPTLISFVESGIRNNIQQISKFFRWMHHSGEFIELGIDDEGIYAIRGINAEKIRTYQMSTGQRSTIAMAVKAEYLGIIMSGIPMSIYDKKRGVFSYEAMRSRLSTGVYQDPSLINMMTPIIKVLPLTKEEMYVLLEKLSEIHADLYEYPKIVTEDELMSFVKLAYLRRETSYITPRTMIRDFIQILDVKRQNPDKHINDILAAYKFAVDEEQTYEDLDD